MGFEIAAFIIVGLVVLRPVLRVARGFRSFGRWFSKARHRDDPFLRQ